MRVWPWAGIALLFLALAGCGNGGGGFSQRSSGQDAGANVFRYPINSNPTSFDPGIVQDGDTLDLLQNVYEGLVTWSEDNTVIGALAEKWEVAPDNKTYTFHLKKDAKFHNGRAVTAEDFKWSIERVTNPKFSSQTATAYLSDIVGVDEKWAGKAQEVTGYQVVDPHTIKITLKRPTPYFLGKLTYLVSAVLPKESVPADKEISKIEEMVGTGPFKVEQYDRDQQTVLAAFKDYHGGAPKLDKIIRPVVKDAMTKLTKFKNGELDMTNLQRADIAGVQKDPELSKQLKFYQRPSIWYIGLNQVAYAPFKDRRVRRAFAMAIDREKIVNERMGGINTIAKSIVPPGIQGSREEAKFIPYDPAGARALLKEAGYGPDKPLPPLKLYFREAFPDIRLVAEAAQGMIGEALNEPGKPKTVDITLQTMEWRAYLERWNKGELPMYHMRWAADFLDPQNFLSHMLATGGPENKLGYSNPEFDRLTGQADSELDWVKRTPLYQQAEDIAMQDAPWIPIYFQRDAELHSPKLSGMRESLFGHLPHTTTTMKP